MDVPLVLCHIKRKKKIKETLKMVKLHTLGKVKLVKLKYNSTTTKKKSVKSTKKENRYI
jgi:ribosomal protein L30/L7E